MYLRPLDWMRAAGEDEAREEAEGRGEGVMGEDEGRAMLLLPED